MMNMSEQQRLQVFQRELQALLNKWGASLIPEVQTEKHGDIVISRAVINVTVPPTPVQNPTLPTDVQEMPEAPAEWTPDDADLG